MTGSRSFYKCIVPKGPGGRECSCCYPQHREPLAKEKKRDERKQRRFFSDLLRKELKEM